MVQRFGESGPHYAAFSCLFVVTRFLQCDSVAHVRAHSWVVTAKCLAEMTMAGNIISLGADTAVLQRRRDATSKQCRRPATMVGLKQLIAVARTLGESHQFVCSVAR
jgi:hypothetical protein